MIEEKNDKKIMKLAESELPDDWFNIICEYEKTESI